MNTEPTDNADDMERDQNEQALRDFFTSLVREEKSYNQALLKAPDAVRQLNKSERGQRALTSFKRLLANGGHGLDSTNWEALAVLCQARGYIHQ